jgi:hypothetical protein
MGDIGIIYFLRWSSQYLQKQSTQPSQQPSGIRTIFAAVAAIIVETAVMLKLILEKYFNEEFMKLKT